MGACYYYHSKTGTKTHTHIYIFCVANLWYKLVDNTYRFLCWCILYRAHPDQHECNFELHFQGLFPVSEPETLASTAKIIMKNCFSGDKFAIKPIEIISANKSSFIISLAAHKCSRGYTYTGLAVSLNFHLPKLPDFQNLFFSKPDYIWFRRNFLSNMLARLPVLLALGWRAVGHVEPCIYWARNIYPPNCVKTIFKCLPKAW